MKMLINVLFGVGCVVGALGNTTADFQEVTHVYNDTPEMLWTVGFALMLPKLGEWLHEKVNL